VAPAGLNIAALAQRTGVRPDTLRKWEQRYGILRPSRTPGGQRRYDVHDVARVEWLKARLAEGYRIGEATALLGGAPAAGRTPEELVDAMLAAVDRLDVDAVDQLLEQTFTLLPLEEALADVVVSTLRRVGERWAAGGFSVAQEHLYSAAVRTRLERLLAEPRAAVRGSAVLACAPGELHDLGLLMLAVGLRADGWRVVYLGASTPIADAVQLATRIRAGVVCVSATTAGPADELLRVLPDASARDGAELVVGGAAMTERRAQRLGARYLAGEATDAVRGLAELGR
jgi:methanogenic corrinoid protein MtbC1